MARSTLDDTARRIARARWLELRCFEVLGGWVTTTPEPEVKLVLARQSHHHAWHAELFERVLPVASGLDVAHHDEPDPGWNAALAEIEALSGTADRLAAIFGVLVPTKLVEYEHWLADTDPVRDAPLRRWLGFVIADEQADLAEGLALTRGFPAAAEARGRGAVEAALLAAGPLLG